MKRQHPHDDAEHPLHSPLSGLSSTPPSDDVMEIEPHDESPPSAKKMLKTLLESEVQRALKELNSETPIAVKSREHRAASLIPEFDPDSEDCTVTAWLRKIEQLGEINAWDDNTKAFHLQDKLRGQARKWYNRLEDYNHSWDDWKRMLIRTFPRHRDYGSMIEEMMHRRKLPSESMTKYYQEKVAMCFRCKLSDSATVSCIIRGLPTALQPNARAFKCERPDELYEGFLCALDDYRPPLISEARVFHRETSRQLPEKKNPPFNPDIDPCPRCKKTGHILRNCPQPDLRTCFKCGNQGHIATRCTNPPKNKPALDVTRTAKDVNILQNYNDIYKKAAKINGTYIKAYLDTGSQVNVITTQIARLLALEITPTSVILKGFSGGFLTSRGEVEFQLEVDGIQLCTKAYTINSEMQDICLLIGQPIINGDGMSLVVSNGKANLQQNTEFTKQIDVVEERERFKVATASSEHLYPGTSIIKVTILDNDEDNNVVTAPRHFELQGVAYSLPATLLRGSVGYMKIINSGTKPVTWKQGEVLARAESCEPPPSHQDVEVSLSANTNLPLPVFSTHNIMSLPIFSANSYNILKTSLGTNNSIGGVDIKEIKSGPLNKIEHDRLISLLYKYDNCFAQNTLQLGCTDLLQMKIKLNSEQPVYRHPYRLSHSEQEIVKSKVSELLNAGIVQESESSFASPVILVKKKNGDYRLCIDYRALNAITIKDRYPLPNIDDQVSKLAGKKLFTSLDLAQGYHQVKIQPEDRHKTAFITPQGHYEYNRVPFGLANAPSVFMRLMNKIVESIHRDVAMLKTDKSNNMTENEVLAFLDDLLVPSTDVKSGLNILEIVLKKLQSENLKLNMSKCSFLQNRITYLGYEISSDGIQPSELKLKAVSEFPIPKNVHDIRQFIGLCSYFRKFIKNFALLAQPLTNLTKKKFEWVWGSEQLNSFEKLKKCLCTKPILALYDAALPTEIHTDACKLGIGGILMQKQNDGTLRPVMYFSRVTSKEETMYHSYELETLAVVESLRRFRVYIVGKHVKVVSDCTAVRATLTKRDILPRIARWWLLIQEYDISVEYRPGDRMKHVDALSRNPVDSINVNRLEISDWFYTVQCQDEKLKSIIDELNNGSASLEVSNNFTVIDDRLYRKTLNGNRLVVPNLARWKIVQMHHDDIGHIGIERCNSVIKDTYWFPKMSRFIKKYVRSCLHCAYGKGEHGKKEGKLHPIPKPTEPMRMVHVDHLGPFCRTKKGYSYMLVLTDAFTKFVVAEPTRTVNSVETVRLLKRIFSLFGYPDRVVTDHGKAFTSRYFKKFVTEKQFKHTLNAIACPRANGQVERTNRTILNALRATDPSEASINWANNLPDVIWGINNTLNDSTGSKPYDLMFARSGRPMCDVDVPGRVEEPVQTRRERATSKIKKATNRMERNFNKRRKNSRVYRKGDLVLWKQAPTSSAAKVNSKLDDIYSGPYIITQVVGNDRYRIRSIKGLRGYKSFTGLVAADSLRPYTSVAPVTDSASSSDDQLETEDLIDLLES